MITENTIVELKNKLEKAISVLEGEVLKEPLDRFIDSAKWLIFDVNRSLLNNEIKMEGCISVEEFDEVSDERDDYETRAGDLEADNEELGERVDELESENSDLKNENEDLINENSNLMDRISELESKLDNLEKY